MFIIRKSNYLSNYLKKQSAKDVSIGFIPTMGALHLGHLSLIQKSKEANGITVCSIFVNPTQFNDPKDFQLYPKTLEQDIYLLEKAHCDVLFLPEVEDIYPDGTENNDNYDLGYLETVLEGKYRPNHFQGVCQVMHRMMTIVEPDQLYLGQKDYQQCMVLKKLLSLIHSSASIVICPTLRETDGLAMSSRNMRLDAAERENAPGMFKALSYINQNIKPGPITPVLEAAAQILTQHRLVPDYITIADAQTLEIQDDWNGTTGIVALIAAFMGKVRLIDNMILPLNFADDAN